jgi:predicted AlkP superfamily phosphohydrolase/phosphomutase
MKIDAKKRDGARGIMAAALTFLALTALSCAGGGDRTRVYVLGLDGASWDTIDPLISQGRLPVFKELKENGAWARLQTFEPTLSAVVWTSIATGKGMLKHGIIDWTFVNKQNIKVPFSSSQKKVPSIWEIMDEMGKRSVVLNWFVTYPPDAVRGVMVSDSFGPAMARVFNRKERPKEIADTVYPESEFDKLYAELDRLQKAGEFQYPRLIADMKIPDYLAEFRARYKQEPGRVPILGVWGSFLVYDRIQDAVVDHYLDENQYDLFLAYYRFPDVFDHFGTLFLETGFHDRVKAMLDRGEEPTPELLSEFNLEMADVSWPLLKDKEAVLKKLYDRAIKEKAYLLVVSDHGFQLTSKGYNHYGLPEGVAPPDGIMMLLGPDVKRGTRVQATIFDIAPTILYLKGMPVGKDMDGKPLLEALTVRRPVKTAVYTRMKHLHGKSGKEMDERKLEELKSLGYIK